MPLLTRISKGRRDLKKGRDLDLFQLLRLLLSQVVKFVGQV